MSLRQRAVHGKLIFGKNGDLLKLVAYGVEEGKVIRDGDVVDETRVESSIGVYVGDIVDE